MRLSERIQQFMRGRYGTDQFSKFLLLITVITIVLAFIFDNLIIEILPFLMIAYSYYRMFSKNHAARYRENQRFMHLTKRLTQLKSYHIYRCPSCRQKIRIPRGKGRVEITCPKCRTQFMKKS